MSARQGITGNESLKKRTNQNSENDESTPDGNSEATPNEGKTEVQLANDDQGGTIEDKDDGAAHDQKEGMCCHLAACFVFIFPSDLQ